MSTCALTRKLQFVYPLAIFMAFLASAGMTVVQAGGLELSHFFPGNRNSRIDRSISSTEIRACSLSDGRQYANRALSCPEDDRVGQWSEIAEDDGLLVSRRPTRAGARNLN